MNEKSDSFQIGLCLAGAISAGAYTAGVIDYLIEALDIWEEKKKSEDPSTVPQHEVKLSVIGGASAGGMSGLIAAKSLLQQFRPVHLSSYQSGKAIPDNPLYHAWVDQLEEELPASCRTMFDYLLTNEDISSGKVQSLLNSHFVRKITDKIIDSSAGVLVKREFLSAELRVFATLTNLQGLEYSLNFKGGALDLDPYRIHDHRDFACFSFGEKILPGWTKIDFADPVLVELYKLAAIGTGAFPIGLSPVKMKRSGKMMQELTWLSHVSAGGGNRFADDWYETTLVDGGMLNNEPFEKVQDALSQVTGQHKAAEIQDYSKVKSTVLMVDPFPSTSNFVTAGDNLLGYVGNVLAALMNQARIKPEHLANSLASNMAGQYVISPSRYTCKDGVKTKIEGAKAIACGSLDGFGGFLSRDFRVHDFFLGRANCEKFLRDHFTVPIASKNPIFENGYAAMDSLTREKFISKTDSEPGIQIIPLFTTRKDKTEMPQWEGKDWPTLSSREVERYAKPIESRVKKVILNTIVLGKSDYVKLWLGARFFLTGRISRTLMGALTKSVKSHDQISE
jgi:predicted acylesterase/phospholipase RssA